jgi:AraC-like DNA-binding protein
MDKMRDDLDLVAAATAPAFVLARDYADGTLVPSHSHAVGQLLHTLTGVIAAETPGRAWSVPPGRALWLPARTRHRFRAIGAVKIRTLYLGAATCSSLPAAPRLLSVTPLIRELILRAEADGRHGTSGPVQQLVVPLLLAELAAAPGEDLSVPLPSSPAMLAFVRAARRNIGAEIPEIAARLGLSPKTLSRKFKRETGLSPDLWRRQARLLDAIAHLREGRSITEVAHAAGYNSSASFAAAFKRCFGMTPSEARDASP